MPNKLLEIFNIVLENNDLKQINILNPQSNLQTDLEMDSIVIAELTVRIEDEFDVDIFENGLIHTIGDIQKVIDKK